MVIIYHQLLQEKCLKPSGRLELRDVLKRDLPDSSLPRSERVCSHTECPAWSSPPGRAEPRRGGDRSDRRSAPGAAPPLPGSAPRSLPSARVCPCAWEARGRGGPAGLPACRPRSPFPPIPVKFGRVPSRERLSSPPDRRNRRTGAVPCPWLCPRAVEGRRARAWRPRGPCVGPRGAEGGRWGSAPRRSCRDRAPERVESRWAPRRGCLSPFPLLSLSFCSSEFLPEARSRRGGGEKRAELEPG